MTQNLTSCLPAYWFSCSTNHSPIPRLSAWVIGQKGRHEITYSLLNSLSLLLKPGLHFWVSQHSVTFTSGHWRCSCIILKATSSDLSYFKTWMIFFTVTTQVLLGGRRKSGATRWHKEYTYSERHKKVEFSITIYMYTCPCFVWEVKLNSSSWYSVFWI